MTINLVTSPDYFDFAELVAEFVSDQRTVLRLTNSVVDKCNEVVTREVDDALDSAESPFRRIMDDQEAEIQGLYSRLNQAEDARNTLHEVLVNVARQDAEVIGFRDQDKKINAIKRLRQMTNCGLLAAKNAVEDPRVWMPWTL